MTESTQKEVLAVHPKQLEVGLSKLVELAPSPASLQQLHIVLPDLSFLMALINLDSDHLAANTVLEAWSIGISTTLIVHRQILPLLPVSSLTLLPLEIIDHKGVQVHFCEHKWLNYSDVALLSDCWLLAVPDVQLTDMAEQHMQRKHVYLVCKRRGYVSRKNNWLRSGASEDPFIKR